MNHTTFTQLSAVILGITAAVSSISDAGTVDPSKSSYNKSKTWSTGGGHFAASASVQAFDKYIPGKNHTINQKANASVKAFGRSKTLANAESAVFVDYHNGHGKLTGRVKTFGRTLLNINEKFSTNRNYRTPTFARQMTVADQRFWLGPVPVRVHAKASLTLYGKATIRIVKSTSTLTPTIEATMEAPLDVAVVASAAVDAWVAAAGVRGRLSLLKSNLKGSAKLYSKGTSSLSKTLWLDSDIKWMTRSLSGRLEAFAKVNYWVGSKTWKKTLASWNGFSRNYPIYSGHKQVWTSGRAVAPVFNNIAFRLR